MGILTLEQIKQAQDVQRQEIEVPEWGGSVAVQGVDVLTGLELLKLMQGEGGQVDEAKAMQIALMIGVVEPKFSESDWEWLKHKSLRPVSEITTTFMRLSGFDQQALKEARKNSSTTGDDASSTP